MVETWNFKAAYPTPLSNKELAALYAPHLSKKSEPVTDTFVDNTVTSMSRAVIPFPDVRQELEGADDDYGIKGPLADISKLLVCVQKNSTPSLIRWTILAIHDQAKAGYIPREGVSLRALQGTKGEKGLIDQMQSRYHAKEFLLGPWLDCSAVTDSTVRQQIRTNLNSHAVYRETVNPIGKPAATGWKMGWPHSWDLTLQLLEGVIYEREYLPAVKARP